MWSREHFIAFSVISNVLSLLTDLILLYILTKSTKQLQGEQSKRFHTQNLLSFTATHLPTCIIIVYQTILFKNKNIFFLS